MDIQILLVVSVGITAYMFLLTVSNMLFFKISAKKPKQTSKFNSVKVSVLIPARNEESTIAHCLSSFEKQTHKNYEVIVLDDNSTDRTHEIATGFKNRIPHLKVIRGQPLPQGWNGKQYASHQLARASSGDVLVFVDADTTHSSETLSFALTNLLSHQSDFLSGYPRQLLYTVGEAFIVPLLFLLMTLVQSFWFLKKSRRGFAAIGQFIMVKRSVYFKTGGFSAIRSVINDDLHFAALLKQHGYTGIFLDLQQYVSVRMYTGFKASFNGISKNIFSALNNQVSIALLIPLFSFFVIYVPFFALGLSLLYRQLYVLALVQIVLMLLLSLLLVINRKLPLASLFYPATYTLLGFMSVNSAVRVKTKKGFMWRGRVVT